MATNSMGNLFFFLPFFFGGGVSHLCVGGPHLGGGGGPHVGGGGGPHLGSGGDGSPTYVGTGHLTMWGRATYLCGDGPPTYRKG